MVAFGPMLPSAGGLQVIEFTTKQRSNEGDEAMSGTPIARSYKKVGGWGFGLCGLGGLVDGGCLVGGGWGLLASRVGING